MKIRCILCFQPTWADFALYNFMEMIRDFFATPLTNYPHVDKFVHKIEELPKVKEWQKAHPNVPFSVFPNPFD